MEVDGALGDVQLAMQLGGLGGQKGWRLGLIRLTAGDLAPVVSDACVVSEARARRGRTSRMMALTVGEVTRGHGLATGAIGRLKEELLVVAGPRFGLVADLALCMRRGGTGFYARQGWTGGGGSWSWRSETLEEGVVGVVIDQGPAPTGGSEGAQAGGKAGGAAVSQRRVLLMVLQRRRQRLQGSMHRSLHCDRCCKCVSRACQRRRWHCTPVPL